MGILLEMYNKYKKDNHLIFYSNNNIVNSVRENFKIIIDYIPHDIMDCFISLINDIRLEERDRFEKEKEVILEYGIKIGIKSQKK